MIDTELDRSIPQNWRERLAFTKEMKAMLIWVWKDLTSAQGKRLAKKILFISFLSAICGLLIPWIMGLILSGLTESNNQKVVISFVAFCCLYLLQLKFNNSQSKSRERMWGENTRQFDNYVLKHFFEKSLGQHLHHDELLNESVLKKGEERIRNIQNGLLIGGIDVILGMLLSYIALWVIAVLFLHWIVGVLATIMIIAHISWSLFLNQKVLMTTIPLEKKWRLDSRYKFERIIHVEKVKTSAKETEEINEIEKRFSENIIPDLKFWLWFINQTGWRGLIARIILLSMVGLGIYRVNHNLIDIGLLIPLMNWAMNLVQNLWQVGDLEYRINYATPPILALKKALSLPIGLKEDIQPVTIEDSPCRIEFKNISFAYPNSQQNVLSDISFTIEPGEKVALLGQSGVGKTTIMKLLLCYFDPNSGRILINGNEMTRLSRKSWLREVGYISQRVIVWNGTIRENLLYDLRKGDKNVYNEQDLWEIIKELQINFVNRLDQGLETIVGENGLKLSGGEAQRLSIGAAVIKNPRVLIIDEATSSLDASTEKLTWEGIEKTLIGARSALIITHRLNTVRNICDKFVFLNNNSNGSYVEAIANSFGELAQKSEAFKLLAKDQGIEL